MAEGTTARPPIVEEGYLRSADGTRLYHRRVRPDFSDDENSRDGARFKARLLIVHGYAEHCLRYGFLTDYFAVRGYDCWSLDFRGHGDSEGFPGYVNRFEDYLDDLDAFSALTRQGEDSADTPRFVIAHSMGALAVARWLEQRPESIEALAPRGIIFSSPFFALKLKVPTYKRLAASTLSGLFPRLTIPNELKAEDLSRDAAVQEAWKKDERMVHKVPVRWFKEALKAQDEVFRDASRIHVPVAIHHGGDDPIADPEASHRFFEILAGDKSWKLWPGLVHEIFNEPERGQVFDALADWIEERLRK